MFKQTINRENIRRQLDYLFNQNKFCQDGNSLFEVVAALSSAQIDPSIAAFGILLEFYPAGRTQERSVESEKRLGFGVNLLRLYCLEYFFSQAGLTLNEREKVFNDFFKNPLKAKLSFAEIRDVSVLCNELVCQIRKSIEAAKNCLFTAFSDEEYQAACQEIVTRLNWKSVKTLTQLVSSSENRYQSAVFKILKAFGKEEKETENFAENFSHYFNNIFAQIEAEIELAKEKYSLSVDDLKAYAEGLNITFSEDIKWQKLRRQYIESRLAFGFILTAAKIIAQKRAGGESFSISQSDWDLAEKIVRIPDYQEALKKTMKICLLL